MIRCVFASSAECFTMWHIPYCSPNTRPQSAWLTCSSRLSRPPLGVFSTDSVSVIGLGMQRKDTCLRPCWSSIVQSRAEYIYCPDQVYDIGLYSISGATYLRASSIILAVQQYFMQYCCFDVHSCDIAKYCRCALSDGDTAAGCKHIGDRPSATCIQLR